MRLLIYCTSFETDNGAYCEKWCNIFLLLRELPAVFVALQMYPGSNVGCPAALAVFVVWCSPRLQSLVSSQKQSLWGDSFHLRLSSCVTVAFTSR